MRLSSISNLWNWISYSEILPHFRFCVRNCRGVTGIFFWGGKVFFPDFFSRLKIPILVDPKQKQKKKTKNKKKQTNKQTKKKRSSTLFLTFPTSIFNFPPSLLNFPSFLLNFHTFSLFSLPLFSHYVSQNFPVRSLWPCLLPPPRLLRHCVIVH